jgi:hypothetical protein
LEQAYPLSLTYNPLLPPFMTFNHSNFSFSLNPSLTHQIGLYPFKVTLTDFFGASSKKYQFEVNIIDDFEFVLPRIYNRKNQSSKAMIFNQRYNYTLRHANVSIEGSVKRDGQAKIKLRSDLIFTGELIKRVTNTTFKILLLNQT